MCAKNHNRLLCSDAIAASARLHWGWIQSLGIRFDMLSFMVPALFADILSSCPPEEELYDSMRSGVLLCQVLWALLFVPCVVSHAGADREQA
jgi:hypothetical protein